MSKRRGDGRRGHGQSRKILRMRERLGEKRCRVMEDKIRGHHRWAQINVNLADIFNGASLPPSLPPSLFLSLMATEE